ncbi:MAG: hypothetical protein HYV08_03375 [Deltaproteobacteria bacterium]|nr:hypothetical protein [Deltaproteobacteria bacterium]MBI3079225.1 hypothetical protein [Deltaproteobacteria bacterium]
MADLEGLFAQLDKRMGVLDSRMASLEERMAGLEARQGSFEHRMDLRMAWMLGIMIAMWGTIIAAIVLKG